MLIRDNLQMFFDFGIENFDYEPKYTKISFFYLFWWVQAFGLL